MAKVEPKHKKTLAQKLLTFQRNGLQQYGKYLDQQLKLTDKMRNATAYKKYIEKQIIYKDKKIKKIDNKLKNL